MGVLPAILRVSFLNDILSVYRQHQDAGHPHHRPAYEGSPQRVHGAAPAFQLSRAMPRSPPLRSERPHAASMASKGLGHLSNAIVAHARRENHDGDICVMSVVIQILREQMPAPLPGLALVHCSEMMHSPSGARKLHNCILKIYKGFPLEVRAAFKLLDSSRRFSGFTLPLTRAPVPKPLKNRACYESKKRRKRREPTYRTCCGVWHYLALSQRILLLPLTRTLSVWNLSPKLVAGYAPIVYRYVYARQGLVSSARASPTRNSEPVRS
jgi:hypothetical protein